VPFRLLYILPGGRAERLQLGEGKFPDEFFYGYCQLARRDGWQVELLARGFHSPMGFCVQKLIHWFTHVSPDFSNAGGLNVHLLDRYDAIVSMSEPVVLMLALRQWQRTEGAKLVLIMMGVEKRIERSRAPWATRRILRWLLRRLAAVIVIGEGERDYLVAQQLASPSCVHLVQFGVDTKFWVQAGNDSVGEYVLAIGNDDGRDYTTLIQAIGSHRLRLHTVHRVSNEPLPPNVTLTRGDWAGQALSDLDLRTLYQGSRFVVTPLHDSTQPQGQSVTLQAMACGKAVILSQTRGLWSRSLMRHLENCYLVPPSDVHALRAAIDHLEGEPALCARIGAEARRSVERHFSSDLMGARIGTILQESYEPVRQAC
jgi:glycosyltransferase involved in cell wall biosynthesis